LLCAALAVLAGAAPGRADVIYSGSSGNLSASADFNLTGTTLTVTLTNTSLSTALVPTDVLTGVFFDTTHTLTPVSAAYANGSAIWYGAITPASATGDGWGYASGVSANGMNSAISATGAVNGLGHSNFSGANNPLQGLDYGILPAGYTGLGANTGITGHGPLIQNSVIFTLTADPNFSLSELGDSMVFQYGTQLSETHFTGTKGGGDPPGGGPPGGGPPGGGPPGGGPPGGGPPGGGPGAAINPPAVPEPSTVVLLGVGLTGLVVAYRRKRAATA
jgi:hypothetical protein